jgi:DNA repair photolyase
MKLPIFNAPRARFCTCLPKYNINTYLGRCAHQCIYCYAVKFPSFAGPASPRLKLLDQIESMVRNTKLKHPVMISDCTDPYQPLEREYKITRRCAEILAKHGFSLLIVTKSDLVTRDTDIFKQTPTVVSMTITTLREDVASFIEPYAPSPDRRVSALQKIAGQDIATAARIDPIVPTINDGEEDFEKLVSTLADVGVKQITIATMKPVRGFFSTLGQTNPSICGRLFRLYADGKWVVGYKYLPEERRRRILEKLRPIVLRHGLSFASCREGFSQFNTAFCDGTAYCRKLMDAYLR